MTSAAKGGIAVLMNKYTLNSQASVGLLKQIMQRFARRSWNVFRRGPHGSAHDSRWQQLELPFSRTPVKRWYR